MRGLSPEYDDWFGSLAAVVEKVATERGAEAVGEVVMSEVFGAWEELPEVWREVFTANGQALLAEIRGGETTDIARLGELRVPTLVVTADDSPEPLRRGSEAVGAALPQARRARVAGGHAIDPAGTEVLEFVVSALAD